MIRPTQRQQKFIKLILENLGNPGNTKTLGELLLEAGYSLAISKNPFLVLNSDAVKEKVDPYLTMLEDKRRMAVTAITLKKLNKANARDAAYVSEVMTKQHQLLSGKETEHVTHNIAGLLDGIEAENNDRPKTHK